MSLFGSIMGDLDEDAIFGHHMRSMSQMNNMMNAMFADPFGGMFSASPFDGMHSLAALNGGRNYRQQQQQQLQQYHPNMHHHMNHPMMPFGFPSMPNINQLLSGQMLGDGGATSFSSSQVVSMTRGPDGRPQVYQASSSTKTGPGGIKETQKTVQDSRSGVKKMAIGHHIGERAHVIEREKNYNTGHEEERQDFINLEEDDADDFNREFTHRSRSMTGMNGGGRSLTSGNHGDIAAIMPPAPASPLAIMGAPVPISSSSTANVPDATSLNSPSKPIKEGATNKRAVSSPITASGLGSQKRNVPAALPRRPLRIPVSSPLTTSIHPHPYGASSSGRRHNRPMKGGASATSSVPNVHNNQHQTPLQQHLQQHQQVHQQQLQQQHYQPYNQHHLHHSQHHQQHHSPSDGTN